MNYKKVLKIYDKMIKKPCSLSVMIDTTDRTGAIWAHFNMKIDDKDLIRKCLTDHNWNQLIKNNDIDYTGREYTFIYLKNSNSLNISYL